MKTGKRLRTALALGFVAGALGLAGCSSEAASKCNQYGDAYCDYLTRCASQSSGFGGPLLGKDACVQAFRAGIDCGSAKSVAPGIDGCISALGSASCTTGADGDLASPAACDPGTLGGAPVDAPPTESCTLAAGASPADLVATLNRCYPTQATARASAGTPNIDVLFVVDNSIGMASDQQALLQRTGTFMRALDKLGMNYHVGVTTTDIGALTAEGVYFPSGKSESCDTFTGQDGSLQNVACKQRSNMTTDGVTVCNTLCPDNKFVPSGSGRYIARENGVSNVPQDLRAEGSAQVDYGPSNALQCIGMVGDGGCGFESPLEAMKRALDGHSTVNAGFLRPDSTLAVVVLTDEDDCSVQLSRRAENEYYRTKDCAIPDFQADYDCFAADFRCMARSLKCNEPMNVAGDKTGCQEREDSYLEPVAGYVSFLKKLRPSSKLLFTGIWTAPSLEKGGKLRVEQYNMGSYGLDRGRNSIASCVNRLDIYGYGLGQIRLSKLAAGLPGAVEASICEPDKAGAVFDGLVQKLSNADVSCLGRAPQKDAQGAPVCVVGDVPSSQPDAAPAVAMPACGAGCCAAFANDPRPVASTGSIKNACSAEPASCYCAVPSSQPTVCSGGAVAGVWRKGEAPASSFVSFRCAAR